MRKPLLAFCGMCFMLLSSCVIAVVDYSGMPAGIPKAELHRTLSFSAGGTISLENTNGDIEIRGWEREEVEIWVEQERGLPPRSVRFYARGRTEPKIHIEKTEKFMKIQTPFSTGDKDVSLFHYIVRVPHSVNFREIVNQAGNVSVFDVYGKMSLELEEGDIKITNFSGSLKVYVSRGDIRAELLDLREEDEVRMTSRQGDIILSLEESVSARVEADAPNGRVSSEFDVGQPLPAQKIAGQIGEGQAFILLSAQNGDIRIDRQAKR